MNRTIVFNKESKDLVVSFEGTDYQFPAKKAVYVEESDFGVIKHLKEVMPMAFRFDPKMEKGEVIKVVQKEKTEVHIPPQHGVMAQNDMQISRNNGMQKSTFSQADLTPSDGQTDTDGVGWYGEGLVIEKKGEGSAFN